MSGKTLTIFAGPNGSGKSTIQEIYKHRTPGITINTDDLAAALGSQVAGAREALTRQKRAMKNNQSFSTETTLSGNSALNLMKKARKQGYRVVLHYICTSSVKVNEARIKTRVALGEHDVPVDDIRRRYDRSLENMEKAISLASICYVFDNSQKGRRLAMTISNDRIRMGRSMKTPPSWLPNPLKERVQALSLGQGR